VFPNYPVFHRLSRASRTVLSGDPDPARIAASSLEDFVAEPTPNMKVGGSADAPRSEFTRRHNVPWVLATAVPAARFGSPVLGTAGALAAITAVTKFATGWWSAGRNGVGRRGKARAGATLVARGEFSIAVAGLAVASNVEPDHGPLTVSYVFLLAVAGPIAARLVEPVVYRPLAGSASRTPEMP
jgi:hypothetical protein